MFTVGRIKEMNKEITLKDIEKVSAKQGDLSLKEMGVRQNGIVSSCIDENEAAKLQNVFSVEVPAGDITNQQKSGRCWMFAGLNVLRAALFKKLNVKSIELSQAYLQFYDKLEKANFALERAIELVHEPIGSRLNAYILDNGVADGGHWAMFTSLVKKYGVVPSSAMKDTAVSKNTAELNVVLQRIVANDIKVFHDMAESGKTEEDMRKKKDGMLEEVYRVLAIALGVPPKTFVLEYKDKDDKFVRLPEMTGLEFFRDYIGVNLDDWISLSDAHVNGWEKGTKRACHYVGNVEGGDPVLFFDVNTAAIRKAVVASLKGGDIVWFAADVSASSLRSRGLLGGKLIRDDLLFQTKDKLSKGEQLDYHITYCNHAMAFTGVNLVNGRPNRYKVENSWGKDNGDGGFFVADAEWFDSYVYQVLVNKKYLPAELVEEYEKAPIVDGEPFDGLWNALD